MSCWVRVLVAPGAGTQPSPLLSLIRQEYWSGLPCPPPGHLPDPGMEPMSLVSLVLAGSFFTTSATWEAPVSCSVVSDSLPSHGLEFSRQEYWSG